MVTYSGFKHWTIYGGMNNIFNRTPPYDPIFANGTLDQSGYDHVGLQLSRRVRPDWRNV